MPVVFCPTRAVRADLKFGSAFEISRCKLDKTWIYFLPAVIHPSSRSIRVGFDNIHNGSKPVRENEWSIRTALGSGHDPGF